MSRNGIFKRTDDLIDSIFLEAMQKVLEDQDDLVLQREFSLNAPIGDGVEPSSDYFRGFRDGVKSAYITIDMIR